MTWKWFLSRTVRQATQMSRHVHRLCSAQRDILSPQAVSAVNAAVLQTQQTIRACSFRQGLADAPSKPVTLQSLESQMAALEKTAVKWLKPYPHASLRENVEVLLVAIAVAMGIRTFFLQPFKIPTGSMQPTLYGITSESVPPDAPIPNAISRFFQYWINGIGYVHVVARADGPLEAFPPPPQKLLLFNLKQSFHVGLERYTVWFPPDDLLRIAGLQPGRTFRRGDNIIRLRVISGDHLFVDRVTYNFRRPRRGEIVVFETRGIPGLEKDQYYIKRLVALGGERVQIGDDRHLRIDGRRLDASTPNFELVYSFTGPPQGSKFSGHLNETVAQTNGYQRLAPLFPNQDTIFTVRPDHYLVMGDNTLHSSDSRSWGDFPRGNVIGKSHFVYWPIGAQDDRPSRFGWGHR